MTAIGTAFQNGKPLIPEGHVPEAVLVYGSLLFYIISIYIAF